MSRSIPLQVIHNVSIVKPNGDLTRESVIIKGQDIEKITEKSPGQLFLDHEIELFDGNGHILSPGMIDQHINGALGCDFNQGSLTEVRNTLQQLPTFGITRILPTLITASHPDMLQAIQTIEEVIHLKRPQDTQILGIHLEGPYLNKDYPGAHPVKHIRDRIQLDELESFLSPSLKLMTLCPEKDPQGAIIQLLAEKGIKTLAGHSAATTEEMYHAVDCGLLGATHLFNAVKPFHHRNPGVIGVTLGNPHLYAEIIADGIHVHPESIKMALNAKGMGKTILVSDAMELAGLPQGTSCQFAGQQVTLMDSNQVVNTSGHIAGSSALLGEGVRNLVQWKILPFEHAIQLASQIPAQFLGEHKLGKIAEGCIADLVLWNKDTLTVEATWIEGKQVYTKKTGQQPSEQPA